MAKNIWLLRHGDASYKTLKVICPVQTYRENNVSGFIQFADTVKDLKKENIVDLQNSIRNFFQYNEEELRSKEIVVWVSPFWRTLQTASELVNYLVDNNYNLKKVSIIDQLREVDGFERPIFFACVNWWEVEIDGEKITLDKSQTNPDNLNHTDYFFQGKYRDLGFLHEKLWKIETYNEITNRSKNVLDRTLQAVDKDTFLFMVTHQAWTDHAVVEKNGYKNGWLQPWEFLIYPPKKEG